MTDAARAAEAFITAARLNHEDPLLHGSQLVFPDYGQVVMTGDLHGHRRNLKKLMRFCDLKNAGVRHVILHEIIHEEVVSLEDQDNSHEVLLDAARWKCEFPDQVHFLLGNHDLAQLNRHEITKNGRVVTLDFESAVQDAYGEGAASVLEAINIFLRSLPLAGRTPNRVLLSHSLPSPRDLPSFDPAVLDRAPTKDDLVDRGPAHALVWGRYHTESALDTLRTLLDVDWFVCGHQPQEIGFEVLHDRMVILASDHNHGVFMPLDLNKPVTFESLTRSIRPFAGVR